MLSVATRKLNISILIRLAATGFFAVALTLLLIADYRIGLVLILFVVGAYLVFFASPQAMLVVALIGASFNFSYELFSGEGVWASPIYLKVIKDALFFLLVANLTAHIRIRSRASALEWFLLSVLGLYLIYATSLAGISIVKNGLSSLTGLFTSLRFYVLYPALPVLIFWSNRGDIQIGRLLNWLWTLCVIVALIAILEYFTPFANTYWSRHVFFLGQWWPRAISTLGNPNMLGIFLVFGVASRLPRILITRNLSSFDLLFTGCIGLAILLTFSRSAVVIAGAVILLVLFRSLYLRYSRRYLTIVSSILLASVFVAGMFFLRSSDTRSEQSFLNNARFSLAISYLGELTPAEFVLGRGFGEVDVEEDVDVSSLADNTRETSNTGFHSMPISLLYYFGIPGLVLFGIIFITPIAVAMRKFRLTSKTAEQWALATGISAAIIAGLLWGFTASTFTVYPLSFLMWVFWGLLLLLLHDSSARQMDYVDFESAETVP